MTTGVAGAGDALTGGATGEAAGEPGVTGCGPTTGSAGVGVPGTGVAGIGVGAPAGGANAPGVTVGVVWYSDEMSACSRC